MTPDCLKERPKPTLRQAATDLALVSSKYLRLTPNPDDRRALVAAMRSTCEALHEDTIVVAADPEALIEAYLNAGGKWADLVAAVSRTRLQRGRST